VTVKRAGGAVSHRVEKPCRDRGWKEKGNFKNQKGGRVGATVKGIGVMFLQSVWDRSSPGGWSSLLAKTKAVVMFGIGCAEEQ